MPKALSLAGLIVAIVVLLLFGLDLAVGFPFSRAGVTIDVGFVICAAILGYLSWTTYRQQI